MKNFFYFLLGSILTWVVAWIYAEKIVEVKHSTKEKARKTKKPTLGIYKDQGKLFIPPGEANYIPEKETLFQYPSKAELEAVPGIKTEDIYKQCFRKYVIERKLTNPEAWKQYQEDYKNLLPRKDQPDIKFQMDKARKAFYSAMTRQRKKLKKKS